MIIDITLPITPEMTAQAIANPKKELEGHLGTHFDVMNKEFPLAYTERQGVIFDVSHISGRDIGISDIDLSMVQRDAFVAFYSGYIERVPYGADGYFSGHPQLSFELIESLVEKGISIIGLDFGGVRRGKEHTPADQFCADRGVFVVENLCNLKELLPYGRFVAKTYPMKFTHLTGLPCRILASVEE